MLKKEITYMGYDGVERTEDFYFNISKSELAEWEMGVDGGYSEQLKAIAKGKRTSEIIETVRSIILRAYGVKSPDGKRFVKSEEISRAFYQTEAYSNLFIAFMKDPNLLADFVNQILPEEARDKLTEAQ